MSIKHVDCASNLVTIAKINPAIALDYAAAVLEELADVVDHCNVADPAVLPEQVYVQVHALKNAVLPTGDRTLIDACTDLMSAASQPGLRSQLATKFLAIAATATSAVTTYRDELVAAASSAAANPPKSSGL